MTKQNSDTKQLFKVLTAAIVGLLAIVILLVGAVLFVGFYDGSTSDNASEEAVSTTAPLGTDEVVDGKDVATGFVIDEGFEIVKATCTGCHSSAIVLQNKFTREGWKAKIVWMQETQGLWDLGDNESIILDYLAKHHAPEPPKGRRLPLKDIEWYELEN
ncbi:hypothetical protein [Algoriphagus terrigena]|uniref:hypothetical protein n=1 Tax=Algoriphagus terrigena TaxID=344884 RepID=UPI000404B7D9|nr:hypothetical protein [Algoriphagus terrigena]